MEITYNQIGTTYDTSRRADPEIAAQIAQQLQIASVGKYLDLACGTGNYTCALSRFGGTWYGCDISHTMLDQAKSKSAQINWSLQNVNKLNYADACFDSISCVPYTTSTTCRWP